MLRSPFHLNQSLTHNLPHPETERQRSVKNIEWCIMGNQGFTWMNQLITELLTAFIAKNTKYKRKNTDSKIINIADCEMCKNRLLAVEYLILIIYNYRTAKTRTLYKSTGGPAGWPTDNTPSSGGLEDFHRTVNESMVRDYSKPGPRIWQWFSSDPDPDPKWWSGIVANTTHCWRLPVTIIHFADVISSKTKVAEGIWLSNYSVNGHLKASKHPPNCQNCSRR